MSDANNGTHGDRVTATRFPPISDMLRAYQRRTGDSQHELSRRSSRSGRQVTQRYLGDVANGKAKSWPTNADTFSAIATAIESTPLAVVLGYASELGVPVEMSAFASRLPPGVDQLDERVQDSIIGLLWSLTSDAPTRRYLPGDLPLIQDETEDDDAGSDPNVFEGRRRQRAEGEQQ